MVYTSATRSLAALEMLVHVSPRTAPKDHVFLALEVEDASIEALDVTKLAADWRADPVPAALPKLGKVWVDAGVNVALKVPSAVIPEESNYILNPAHVDFARLVRVQGSVPFRPGGRRSGRRGE